MAWDFDNNKPIYIQLVEALKLQIISGKLKQGQRLASVRELAEDAGVNPNTMQRALAELERQELVFTQRTSGRFVTDNEEQVKSMRDAYATIKIEELITALLQLGYEKGELLGLIQAHL